MRVQHGVLAKLKKETGIEISSLSSYIGRHKFPSRKRAVELEAAAKKIGKYVPADVWLLGTSNDIKERLNCKRAPSNRTFKSGSAYPPQCNIPE